MADSLSLAFPILLESLTPEQRAAFLLREVFDEPYDRIAEIVGTSEQNASHSPHGPAVTWIGVFDFGGTIFGRCGTHQ
jgi:Sigma-70, region 4